MARKTDALGAYEALARDMEREVRRVLVTTMEEENVIAKAEGLASNDLARKYGLNNMGLGDRRG